MTTNNEIDNDTVRRFAKIIKGNQRSSKGSVGITTGTVVQNGDQLSVIVDDETIVPISDATSKVRIGDKVTVAVNSKEGLIVGNNTDVSPTVSEIDDVKTNVTYVATDVSDIRTLATEAKITAASAQSTAEEAKITAASAQSTAEEAKITAASAQSTAEEAKKCATDYIKYDSTNGLVVFEKDLPYDMQIKSDGLYFRHDSTDVISFKEDAININTDSIQVTQGTNSIVKLKSFDGFYECKSKGIIKIDFPTSEVGDDYSLIGCVGWTFSNDEIITISNDNVDATTWRLTGYYIGSEEVSNLATIKLLYIKSGWL
jgi:hypothetical protein